jgi:CheY-like chemotaxis protein
VKPVDRESLKAWYRNAMRGRVLELEALRAGVLGGDLAASASARDVGHALKGSGGSFGFPRVTEAGALVEGAPAPALARRTEGLIALLRRIAWPEDPSQHMDFAWLSAAAGVDPVSHSDPHEAWAAVAAAAGLSEEDLADKVAARFGLERSSHLDPTRQALRLVPEALLRDVGILPLSEDGVRIRVASWNPTSLVAIDQIHRLSGRSPDFVVTPPATLQAAWDRLTDESPAGPGRPRVRAAPAGRRIVLLVDDDPLARVIARSVLEKRGYGTLEASSAEAGLEVLEGHPEAALLVVDLSMPGMGGREMIRAVRARAETAHMPVMVLTGSDDPVLEADLIEDGADDYIRKPLDPRLFAARVAATLRRVGS